MTPQRCHELCCDKPRMKKGGGRYCRAHRASATADAFGDALRAKIAELPQAMPHTSYLDAGEIDEISHGWSYVLQTRAGQLVVSFHDGDYSLYGRFDDEKAGRKLTGDSNPYSGKWNHHITDEHPVESAVLYVMNQLERVL